ncbi:MAG: aminopeptidase P family protein [Clostridia bacterium]|nr:aminopeptidase P family protein [Clostridia bacterium]
MPKNTFDKELENRLSRLHLKMSNSCPDWDTAIILDKVNQYYLAGTMQDGIIIIKRDGGLFYFVRKSLERANNESPISNIYPMNNYGDAAKVIGADLGITLVETNTVTLSIMKRLQKYFTIRDTQPLDKIIFSVRSIKSPFELELMTLSGKKHNDFFQNIVPDILSEGMSEADFLGELYKSMLEQGYQGISRFSMFQTEMVAGQVAFGESSLYPTNFDGPGGSYGMYPAVPFVGSRERRLEKGDLVFVDLGFGIHGYHSDKTQIYIFGGKPSDEALEAHQRCIDIQARLAKQLKPGEIPSEIYDSIMNNLDEHFIQNFMGFGDRKVKFLGHGIGLHIDEPPVIAKGFNKPLEKNMVIALEPKKGIAAEGMVGVEDTYIVEDMGGRCITGGGEEIIMV